MDLRLLTSSRFPPIVGGCWFCPGRARGSGNWEGGERGMLLKIPAALDREREREKERGVGSFQDCLRLVLKAAIRRKTFSTSGKQDGSNSASAAVGRAELSELPQWGEGKGPWRGGRRGCWEWRKGSANFWHLWNRSPTLATWTSRHPEAFRRQTSKLSVNLKRDCTSICTERVSQADILFQTTCIYNYIYTFVWLRWGYLIWRVTKKGVKNIFFVIY